MNDRTTDQANRSDWTDKTQLTTDGQPIFIRWMGRRDLTDVMAIERLSFIVPWTIAEFITALSEKDSWSYAAEYRGRVVGYFFAHADARQLFLTTLAVHPSFRRRHIGAAMIVAARLSATKWTRIVIPVAESHVDAQLFLRGIGVKAVAVAREYFPQHDGYMSEDAFIFHKYHDGESEIEAGETRGTDRSNGNSLHEKGRPCGRKTA
jgi:ribosomal-protein-alanine N-acetyltransferase